MNPNDVIDVKIMDTVNVSVVACGANVRRVVHTSTSEVDNTAQNTPINEDHRLLDESLRLTAEWISSLLDIYQPDQ